MLESFGAEDCSQWCVSPGEELANMEGQCAGRLAATTGPERRRDARPCCKARGTPQLPAAPGLKRRQPTYVTSTCTSDPRARLPKHAGRSPVSPAPAFWTTVLHRRTSSWKAQRGCFLHSCSKASRVDRLAIYKSPCRAQAACFYAKFQPPLDGLPHFVWILKTSIASPGTAARQQHCLPPGHIVSLNFSGMYTAR